MQIAMSPTREKYPLSPKKIFKKTFTRAVFWVIILMITEMILAGVYFGSHNDPTYPKNATSLMTIIGVAAFVLVAVIILLIYLYQRWYFAVYFYDLTDDYVIIRKGPITPKEITIPYERLQDVYVDQDLLDRILGLYDVHLSSATISSGMQAHIDGVDRQAANGLREFILKTVSAKLGKRIGNEANQPKAE